MLFRDVRGARTRAPAALPRRAVALRRGLRPRLGRLRAAVSDDDGHPPENGPLAEEAASAGAGYEGHSQGAITGQIEARRAGVLKADLGSKPASGGRGRTPRAQDTGARAFIMAVPMEGLEIPNREWVECVALYLALPSPAMAAHVGVGVPCRGVDRANWPVIDEDGDVFFTNNRLPSGLFVDLLRGRAVRGGTDGLARLDDRQRRAVVPDLLWHEGEVPVLGDVKTLAFCRTHYKDSDGSKREAVERKARSVVVDFKSKLHKIDKDVLDTPQGQVGPLVQRLNSAYAGKVVGLVFGGFNEFSEDVHGVLTFAAKSLAEKASAEDGFISVEHAEAVCRQRFVRALGPPAPRTRPLRGLTFLDTHGKVRPNIKPHCERHWRQRQDAVVHWRLPRLVRAAPAVVPPLLAQFLRPHQREGVQFLYDCVAGLREYAHDYSGQGAILADDMGLGKTLQTVALVYALLQRGSVGDGSPVKRVVVACPCSLVPNWKAEFDKWVNARAATKAERVDCRAVDGKVGEAIDAFLSPGRPFHVLLISYESLKLHVAKLSATTWTSSSRSRLCEPGVLGTPTRSKTFDAPIAKGLLRGAAPGDVKLAQDRQKILSLIAGRFLLRREQAERGAPALARAGARLPAAAPQRRAIAALLGEKRLQHALAGKQADVLAYIGRYKKICDHPSLDDDAGCDARARFSGERKSGKLHVLYRLLRELRGNGGQERVVVVANQTSSLELAAARCWRDGNPRRCYTYRLLTAGTIEEKIYQRQLAKEACGAGGLDPKALAARALRGRRDAGRGRAGVRGRRGVLAAAADDVLRLAPDAGVVVTFPPHVPARRRRPSSRSAEGGGDAAAPADPARKTRSAVLPARIQPGDEFQIPEVRKALLKPFDDGAKAGHGDALAAAKARLTQTWAAFVPDLQRVLEDAPPDEEEEEEDDGGARQARCTVCKPQVGLPPRRTC
ncbi:hypothetical protein JL721_9695 [Aureococcus anophagefferens]|nr:hypothetical protein JL721_9695 [Aureococcus anophagefferens]